MACLMGFDRFFHENKHPVYHAARDRRAVQLERPPPKLAMLSRSGRVRALGQRRFAVQGREGVSMAAVKAGSDHQFKMARHRVQKRERPDHHGRARQVHRQGNSPMCRSRAAVASRSAGQRPRRFHREQSDLKAVAHWRRQAACPVRVRHQAHALQGKGHGHHVGRRYHTA